MTYYYIIIFNNKHLTQNDSQNKLDGVQSPREVQEKSDEVYNTQ